MAGRGARKTGGFLTTVLGRPVAARTRQKTRCGSRRQSGGAHFVHEFLRAARVQIAPEQLTDLRRVVRTWTERAWDNEPLRRVLTALDARS